MFALKLILRAYVPVSLAVLVLSGCGGGGSGGNAGAPEPLPTSGNTVDGAKAEQLATELASLHQRIGGLVDGAQVCGGSADCANLYVGELYQGCGDADTYLAYAPQWIERGGQRQLLDKLVADYDTIDRERDQLLHAGLAAASVCKQNPPPAVECIAQRCTNDQQKIQAFTQTNQQLAADWERLSKEIQTLVGDAWCDSALDCRSIAFGHKPCGGPSAFLAYSVLNTDPLKLAPTVGEFNEVDRQLDVLYGYASTCDIVMPQPVECVNNHCQETSRYFSGPNTGGSEPTNADSTNLKTGIDALLGNVGCASSEQCADAVMEYSGDACEYEERIAFSMANPPDMPLLASKLRQYVQKVAEEMTQSATDGKVSGSLSADLQLGSCVEGRCAGHVVKSLFCNDLTGRKTKAQ